MTGHGGWKRSSRCNGGDHLEVWDSGHGAYVRSAPGGRILHFSPPEWKAFLQGVRAGEFSLEAS